MSAWHWLALAAGLYASFVIALMLAGRREAARAVAGFVPDCLVLARRLLADPRVPRRHKLMLGALVVYLAMPFDLVPDFIPVAGLLDDAILVATVLRSVVREVGPELVEEHWPGPVRSLPWRRPRTTSPHSTSPAEPTSSASTT